MIALFQKTFKIPFAGLYQPPVDEDEEPLSKDSLYLYSQNGGMNGFPRVRRQRTFESSAFLTLPFTNLTFLLSLTKFLMCQINA